MQSFVKVQCNAVGIYIHRASYNLFAGLGELTKLLNTDTISSWTLNTSST